MPVLTDEQLQRLRNDAHAYRLAAEALAETLLAENVGPMEPRAQSLHAAILVNCGLSLELSFKALCAMQGTAYPATHSLADLYATQPAKTRDQLDEMYRAFKERYLPPGQTIAVALRTSPRPPEPLVDDAGDFSRFDGLLRFWDTQGLFAQRYAFESYASDQWYIRLEKDWLLLLLDAFVEFLDDW